MLRAGIVGLVVIGCGQPARRPQPAAPPVAPAPQQRQSLAIWDDDRLAGDHAGRAVFASRVAADGTLLDPQGIAVDDRFTAFHTQPVAAATTSGWLAAWERVDSDHPQRVRQIWARRVSHAGAVGALVELSRHDHSQDAQLATAGDDALIVWWRLEPPSVQASLIVGDRATKLDFGKPTMSVHPSVAFDAKANVWLIVWRDGLGGISGTRIDRNGALLDQPFLKIAKDQKPRWDLGPRIATQGNGEFFVTWASGDDQSLVGVRVDARSGAALAAPSTLATSPFPIFRHAIGATLDGYALAWIDMPKGPRTLHGAWITDTGATPLALPAQPGIGYAPAFQTTGDGLLVSWHESPEPRAAQITRRGQVDTNALTLRLAATARVTTTPIRDDVAADGADYCGTTRDRTLPGTLTGVLVEEGDHPWGKVHTPGFGWGYVPTDPGWQFHVGRDWAMAPKLTPPPGTQGITMSITIPDANRHRVQKMETVQPTRAAVGVDEPVNLVEVEVNQGLGGRGSHFVMTKVRVVESLSARLASLRTRFDATVAAQKQTIDQLLDAEDKKLKATLKDPIVKKLPRTASVVYEPTWRPSTKRVEVLFGYKIDGGYVVDMPASNDGNTKRESRPAGPVPVRYGIYFGVRYTLEGDRVVAEELFAPRVPTRQAPWDCTAPSPAK
jgi:hypothetical protein